MPSQWTAEFEITCQQAAEIISAQFPALAPVRCAPLGVGWDNVALSVNDTFVFRFPRRQLGADLMEAELRVMPAVAPALPLPVSAAAFIGEPTDEFKWRFGGYPIIPGTTACRAHLNEAQRLQLAESLARFLGALHRVDANLARANGAARDPLGRLNFPARIDQARDRLNYVIEHKLFDHTDALAAIIDSTPTDFHPREDVLVHGDLYARHLIVDDARRLIGIIDWGDVHLGDPIVDLAAALLLLPAGARPVFDEHYGPIDALSWRMARFHATRHTLCVVPYAHQTGDGDLLRESLVALKHVTQYDSRRIG